jgi:hypothetical protein
LGFCFKARRIRGTFTDICKLFPTDNILHIVDHSPCDCDTLFYSVRYLDQCCFTTSSLG